MFFQRMYIVNSSYRNANGSARRETIYRWIETKDMPGHRVGRSWKFKKDEVDAWVKSDKAAERE